ncbi:MAG: acyl-CoA dehydrogenase family protein [Burkholderiales bacterium]|nr:acyl-CoA dehydrogenase family protein [Burkholderiales bacterium]
MDFDLTEEQQLLADSVAKFLDKNYSFATRQEIIASRGGYSPLAWEGLAGVGLLGAAIPDAYGGFGGGGVETSLVMEAFGRHLVVEPYLATAVMAARLIATAGTDEQKKYLLPSIADGSMRFACGFHEPGSRYDLGHVETTARQENGMWVLNGVKSVVMHGAVSDLLIVSARTSGKPGDPDGISLFFVNPGEEGVAGREYPTYDGNRAAELIMLNVTITPESLIGNVDKGLPLVELTADRAMAALCAEAVGCMDALNQATLEYLKTRQQFGVPIGRFQVLQHRMVDMLMHHEQAKSMALLAAVKVDSEDAVERRRAVSAAKELIGRSGRFIGQQAVQLHGGMGMTHELAVGHYVKRLAAIDTSFGDSDHQLDQFAAAESARPVERTQFEKPRSKWKQIA